ncbi:MAG TPA: alpha/beta fold hydrolase, partial [Gammaproteobacteria bacterium]
MWVRRRGAAGMRRLGMTLAGVALPLLAGYLALLLTVYFGQSGMLYFPTRELTADPAARGLAFTEVQLRASDGVALHGWYLPHPAPRGALLFLHGNAGNIGHRLDSLAQFHRLGLATLIVDYRGYGRSAGQPDEPGTYRDAEAAWQQLVGPLGFDPARVVVFGRSLGGALAARVAAEHAPAGLIL